MSRPLLPDITRKGQPYVDEPVFVEPKRPSELAYAVGRCFTSAIEMARRTPPRIQTGWDRVILRWR